MHFNNMPLISFMIFLPMILGILIMTTKHYLVRIIGFFSSVLLFCLSIFILFHIDLGANNNAQWQFVEKITLSFFSYYVGIDVVSAFLMCLTSFIIMLCIFYGCFVKKQSDLQISMLFFLEALTIGAFSSLDLLLFYIFFEGSLIPLFFIIGYVGSGDSIYASFKLFLYTIAGSLLMLLVIAYLYFVMNVHDIDGFGNAIQSLTGRAKFLIWLALFLSFAVKVPMLPLHTWLPDAHSNAPVLGSVVLASIVLKLGSYGILRFVLPFFSDINEHLSNFILFGGILAVIYGALVSFAQCDIKKIVAYSSISHMGFVTAGLFTHNDIALTGSILQMISHGISSAALFFCTGFLHERSKTRNINDYGGFFEKMPFLSFFFLIFIFSSIGVPGTSGFVSEFLIIVGSGIKNLIITILLSFGFIFSALYMLNFYKKIFTGDVSEKMQNYIINDLSLSEAFILLSLTIFVLLIGIYPKIFLELLENFINTKFNYS